MPDQIQKQTVIAITASVQLESGGRTVYIPIRLPLFQRRHGSCCENQRGSVLGLAWSGFGHTYLVQKQLATVCKDHRAWFWQNETCPLPVSLFSDTVAFVKLPLPLSLSLTHAIFSWNSLRLSLAPCSFHLEQSSSFYVSCPSPGTIVFIGFLILDLFSSLCVFGPSTWICCPLFFFLLWPFSWRSLPLFPVFWPFLGTVLIALFLSSGFSLEQSFSFSIFWLFPGTFFLFLCLLAFFYGTVFLFLCLLAFFLEQSSSFSVFWLFFFSSGAVLFFLCPLVCFSGTVFPFLSFFFLFFFLEQSSLFSVFWLFFFFLDRFPFLE